MHIERPGETGKKQLSGSSELERGSSVGRYLVLALLGKGGMGEVYAAYDPELDRKIALKLLRGNVSVGGDPSEGRARLLREAQAIARLSDPNVVVVFDVGMFGDRVFLAMEFVDGTTLSYWIQAQTRSWREVVRVFTKAGQGLASAHRAGLVHRDFKPDNVMIGHDGQVRVMDFGLARTIDSEKKLPAETVRAGTTPVNTIAAAALEVSRSTGDTPPTATGAAPWGLATAAALAAGLPDENSTTTRDMSPAAGAIRTDSPTSALNSPLTLSGAMMGTPAYMAPEQFEGGTVDARTDQFSFCVAIYEALYAQRPFAGRNIHELTANVLEGRVRDAPANARVPGWVRKVLLRGLRIDRTQRHPSMEALLAELARNPAGTRRRWAAGLSVMTVIAMLGVGLFRAQRLQRIRCLGADAKLAGIWELPSRNGLSLRKQAIQRAFMATGKPYAGGAFAAVIKALDGYVVDWNTMHRESCEATNMRGEQSAQVLDLRTNCLNDRFSELRALTNVFSDANGEVVSKAVAAAQSLTSIQQCADIVTLRALVRPPNDPVIRRAVTAVRNRLADVKAMSDAGKYKKASDQIDEIMQAARETEYKPVMAEAFLRRGNLEVYSSEPSKAAATLERSVWMADACRHDEVVVEAAAELIYVTGYLLGRYVDGERWARHVAAGLQRLGPGHDVIAGWRANNLGVMYEKEGRLEESLAANLEAVALKSRALGPAHFDVGISHVNVALSLSRLGRVDEALEQNEKGLGILRAALGSDHPQVAISLVNEAEFLNTKRRYSEGRLFAVEAMGIWEREWGPDHPFLAYALTAIGESLVNDGKPGQAIPYLERAIVIRESKDPETELLGQTRFALARALWESNNALARAMSLADKARANYGGSPLAKKQRADIDSWIDEHSLRVQRTSVH